MPGNYQKEAAWLKGMYTDLRAGVDKELADKLKAYLEEEAITYADCLREKIKETIGRSNKGGLFHEWS